MHASRMIQFWEGGDAKKPQVTDAAKQYFARHRAKKRPGLRLFHLHSVKRG
jgi:hypothetical protein